MARANFALKGLDLEIGSVEEALAIRSFKREQTATYVQTMTMVHAILYGAQAIITAVQNSDQNPSNENLNKSLSVLQDLLVPDDGKEKQEKAEKAMKIVQEEINKGPFKVEGMVYNKPKRTR